MGRWVMRHYIYFIQCGHKRNPIKIGVAINVSRRLKELQTGNPYKLKILDIYECKSRSHAYDLEARLHKTFKKKRMEGEWFNYKIYWRHLDFLPTQENNEYSEEMMIQIQLANNAGFFI